MGDNEKVIELIDRLRDEVIASRYSDAVETLVAIMLKVNVMSAHQVSASMPKRTKRVVSSRFV